MDWLLARQDDIESQLARRHITPAGIAMFDLSSSWVEGQGFFKVCVTVRDWPACVRRPAGGAGSRSGGYCP
jgi:hypothetical protein